MKSKKQSKKNTQPKSAEQAPVETAPKAAEKASSPAAAEATDTAATVPAPAQEKEKTPAPKKEKAPSISASVRRIMVRRPQLTAAEVSQALIDEGWDAGDVEKRASTIATLRTDALAIIAIAKEEGCWK
jgi:hypothetical protein